MIYFNLLIFSYFLLTSTHTHERKETSFNLNHPHFLNDSFFFAFSRFKCSLKTEINKNIKNNKIHTMVNSGELVNKNMFAP